MASLTPSAAKVAANDLWSRKIIFGELITYLRTPFAEIPYKIKMIRVMAIKIRLRRIWTRLGMMLK